MPAKNQTKYNDPLKVTSIGADYFGSMSAKLELDPDYGRKFYTIMYFSFAVIIAIIAIIVKMTYAEPQKSKRPRLYGMSLEVIFFAISGFFLLLAFGTFIFYKKWKNYDIASSKVYCERINPPGTPKYKIRECIQRREMEERMNNNSTTMLFF